jgi:hypothetical protein
MRGDLERSPLLEEWFPDLTMWGYRLTSDIDFEYNCIAWAAGDDTQQWWPEHGYWPPDVRRELTVDAFVDAFATRGYEPCEGDDYEPGYERIAIYVSDAGRPLHAARQLDSERWTSKCGDSWDISHPLRALEGKRYGHAKYFLRRPKRVDEPQSPTLTIAPSVVSSEREGAE